MPVHCHRLSVTTCIVPLCVNALYLFIVRVTPNQLATSFSSPLNPNMDMGGRHFGYKGSSKSQVLPMVSPTQKLKRYTLYSAASHEDTCPGQKLGGDEKQLQWNPSKAIDNNIDCVRSLYYLC